MLLHSRPQIFAHRLDTLAIADGDWTIANLLGSSGANVGAVGDLIILGNDGRRMPRIIAEACSDTLSADATANYALHAVTLHQGVNGTTATTMRLGTGTATIGTKTGVAGGVPDNTHRFADALTWTETGYYADLRAGLQGAEAAVHSPADNTIARLIVGDVGFADALLLESVAGLKWRVMVGV